MGNVSKTIPSMNSTTGFSVKLQIDAGSATLNVFLNKENADSTNFNYTSNVNSTMDGEIDVPPTDLAAMPASFPIYVEIIAGDEAFNYTLSYSKVDAANGPVPTTMGPTTTTNSATFTAFSNLVFLALVCSYIFI